MDPDAAEVRLAAAARCAPTGRPSVESAPPCFAAALASLRAWRTADRMTPLTIAEAESRSHRNDD